MPAVTYFDHFQVLLHEVRAEGREVGNTLVPGAVGVKGGVFNSAVLGVEVVGQMWSCPIRSVVGYADMQNRCFPGAVEDVCDGTVLEGGGKYTCIARVIMHA